MKEVMVWLVIVMFFTMVILGVITASIRDTHRSATPPAAPGAYSRTLWSV